MRKAWNIIPKETDPHKKEQLKKEPLEPGDIPAMMLASALAIFLPTLFILLLLCGVCYVLFVG